MSHTGLAAAEEPTGLVGLHTAGLAAVHTGVLSVGLAAWVAPACHTAADHTDLSAAAAVAEVNHTAVVAVSVPGSSGHTPG